MIRNRLLSLSSLIIVGVLLAVLIVGGYLRGWTWTGFHTSSPPASSPIGFKTLWDWLDLLVIPLTLAALGFVFNRSERLREQRLTEERTRIDREIATEQRCEQSLQLYFDRMSDLLLDYRLRQSEADSEARALAHSRTLTAIRSLDLQRKAILLRFLFESKLINTPEALVPLGFANLAGIDLRRVNLNQADLRGVDLSTANLRKADLFGADLSGARLVDAILVGTGLFRTTLTGSILDKAHLIGADLTESDMIGASLREAEGQSAVFRGAKLIKADFAGAKLPEANFDSTDTSITDLSGASFVGADLTGARFVKAYLFGTDFTGATTTGVDFTDTVMLEVKGLVSEPASTRDKQRISLDRRLRGFFVRPKKRLAGS